MPTMRADERYVEQLHPNIGYHLATAMAENQRWLTTAEERVGGDIQRACDLVEVHDADCQSPELKFDPKENRMAAYLILLSSQQEWFGAARTSPDDLEGFTLANTTQTGLILMRKRPHSTTTLLEATATPDRQVRVSKVEYSHLEAFDPTYRAITEEDKDIMSDTTSRLRRVNRKWHQLLKEHPFRPPRDQLRVPLPRMPSAYS